VADAVHKAPPRVWLVGAGPGDPGLITCRGRELLADAEVVLYDALAHPALLRGCRSDAHLVDVGKRYGQQAPPQAEVTERLLEFARRGKSVVRLKGGDPFLFSRGAEEAEALVRAGIPFEVVPGVSSPVGTATYAGFPLTHRDLSSSVAFVTGSDRHGRARTPDSWAKVAAGVDTVCVLMGMRHIAEITQAMSLGRSGGTPAAVIQWGARSSQRVVVATLGTIAAEAAAAGLTNPAVVVVGEVVRLRDLLRWYDTKPLFGRRLLVLRPEHQAQSTAKAIRARGAEPIVTPAIAIHPPPEPERLKQAAGQLPKYDWVVFTSANGVLQLFSELSGQNLDARAFGHAKLAAIGPKTAAALSQRGLRADHVATAYVGEVLAEGLLAHSPKRVLLLRALEARDTLPDLLRGAGVNVDVVPAYQTTPVSEAEGARLVASLQSQQVDAVLFTASSTVTSLLDVLGQVTTEVLAKVVVASIGPVTSETARRRGLRVDVTAEQYTVDGLLDALERYYTVTASADREGPPGLPAENR